MEEDEFIDAGLVTGSEEVEEVPVLHELGDDVVGGLPGADADEADQVWMSHGFHY